MVTKPVVFVSTTSDLQSARKLVGEVLYSMGYEPHWQDIQPTDGGEMLAVLRGWIEPSALVIQLVGQRYGAEPPTPTAEFGRVSYTQFEALYAEKAGKKVIYHFMEPGFPTDPAPAEAEELTRLQATYREGLVAANKLRHGNIANPADLELSVRRLRDELAALRAQGERRFRRLAALVAAALAAVLGVAGLVLWALHQQRKTHEQVVQSSTQTDDKLDAIRKELREALAPKPLAAGQTEPPPLPPELIEKAKLLLERGNAEDQALAKIALKQHDEANRIIQELKSKPGNPIDEAVRLLTMEGDNWYQAGQPDKAIEPLEQALALRPADVQERNQVAVAHTAARLGNIADHRRRAIDLHEGTLKLVSPGSAEWATTHNNLGVAWAHMPTGNRSENLHKAIAAFEAALTVRTKEAHPADWAMTQNNLGNAWRSMPTGDRGENLRKAIAAYEAALTVQTKDGFPSDWAMTQNNLGVAWQSLQTGDRAENLRRAIAAYEAALTVQTKDGFPSDWAMTQNNLGTAWADMPRGNRGENLGKAIAAYEVALTVRTKDAYPTDWAVTQNNLGTAWADMPTGDRSANLHKAIAAYEAALTVYTKNGDPVSWATTQINLGEAWRGMPTGDPSDNLHRAMTAYEEAMTVFTKDDYPWRWAAALCNMGIAWRSLPTGNRSENVRKAITAYEAALTVQTKDSQPTDWAGTQINLGIAWTEMPTGDQSANLRKAIAAYDAALTVFTNDAYPADWAKTQNNLGIVWSNMPTGDRNDNQRKAIAAYEAALTVRTKDALPFAWAMTHHNLAIAFADLAKLPGNDRLAWLERAIASEKAVLSVCTAKAFPQQNFGALIKLKTYRRDYEAAGGAEKKPFDAIEPAK
jgi:tetratricopeptide (TPR) repeat protein